MSIPLDKLYNFLQDRCDRDALIYRFLPHGSKNPNDLKMLTTVTNEHDAFLLPQIVFHDQELLDFDSWKDYPTSFLIPNTTHSKLKAHTNNYNVYDKILLVHSEKNSSELKKFVDDGAIGVYYWSHALIARDWFRYAEHDLRLNKKSNNSVKFLIYNRAWTGTREYRLKFFELLVRNNLQNFCLTTFCPTDNNVYYKNHEFKNLALKISNFDLENIFPLNTYPSHASADYEAADYVSSDIEVVLETIFDDSRIHLTEKTLRPIATGQPFILCGPCRSLDYLRQYGFKTFSSVWDESYDTITDSSDRLESILTLLKKLESTDLDWQQIKSITEYNKQWFFSDEFYNLVVNEFKENMTAGLTELSQFKSGKYFIRRYEILQSAQRWVSDAVHEIYKNLTTNQLGD